MIREIEIEYKYANNFYYENLANIGSATIKTQIKKEKLPYLIFNTNNVNK